MQYRVIWDDDKCPNDRRRRLLGSRLVANTLLHIYMSTVRDRTGHKI